MNQTCIKTTEVFYGGKGHVINIGEEYESLAFYDNGEMLINYNYVHVRVPRDNFKRSLFSQGRDNSKYLHGYTK